MRKQTLKKVTANQKKWVKILKVISDNLETFGKLADNSSIFAFVITSTLI